MSLFLLLLFLLGEVACLLGILLLLLFVLVGLLVGCIPNQPSSVFCPGFLVGVVVVKNCDISGCFVVCVVDESCGVVKVYTKSLIAR